MNVEPQWLDSLLEVNTDPALVVDLEFRYLAFNRKHKDYMKSVYRVDIEKGTPLLECIDLPLLREKHQKKIQSCIDNGDFADDIWREFEDGKSIIFRTQYTALKSSQQKVVAVLIYVTESLPPDPYGDSITVNRKRLEFTLESAEEAYWEWDVVTEKMFFSKRFSSLLGYAREDFPDTQSSWLQIVHPSDRSRIDELFQKLKGRSDLLFDAEFRIKTASGGWKYLHCRCKVIERNSEGESVFVAGTCLDVTQRTLMEEALKESEARWDSLVKAAPVLISIFDSQGTLLFLNRSASGNSENIFLGKKAVEILPESAHEGFRKTLREVFEEKKTGTYRIVMKYQDGTHHVLENYAGPVLEHENVKSMLVITIDITERVAYEKRLELEGKRQQVLLYLHLGVDRMGSNLFELTLKAVNEITQSDLCWIAFVSESHIHFRAYAPKFKQFFEWTDSFDLFQMETTGQWREYLRKPTHEFARIFSPESDFEQWISAPIFESDVMIAVLGVARARQVYNPEEGIELRILLDGVWHIYRRRQAEDVSRKFSQAIETSPISIAITDQNGVVEYVNSQYCHQMGISSEAVIGKLHPLLQEGYVDPLLQVHMRESISTHKRWQGDIEIVNFSNQRLWESVILSPMDNPSNSTVNFVLIEEDVTEKKRAMDAVFQAQKMESIGQLSAGVAHDFNNLLTSLLNYNELLLRKIPPGESLRVYPEKIQIAGLRAADLVSSLLALGRQQRLSKARSDLRELVRKDEPLFKAIVKSECELTVTNVGEPLMVEMDSVQISQVVINLISNAKDALKGKGRIEVTVGPYEPKPEDRLSPGLYACVQVRDNGPGISSMIQERIFEPFFTTKEYGKGTGLGLSVAFGIVQQHLGSILLKSKLNEGACFSVVLPIAAATSG